MNKRVVVKVGSGKMTIELDATAFVKWENRAAAEKKTLTECLSLFLTNEVQRT